MLIFGTFLLIGLVVITFIELTSGGIFQPAPQSLPPQQRPLPYSPYQQQAATCGDVSIECKVSANARVKRCKLEDAEEQISNELAYPLRTEACRQAERDLAARCPKDCPLDYSTVTVFGGPLDLRAQPVDDEGYCTYVGQKAVTIKGTCTRAVR